MSSLSGWGVRGRSRAFALAVSMFSLAVEPPLAGFWGKLTLLTGSLGVDVGPAGAGTWRPWFVLSALIAVLNAAIAMAYYLRIVAVMYFRAPVATAKAEGAPRW